MKRRPMLIYKYNGKVQEKGREVIGLIGTHRGVGVTHTALMLAFYMGEVLGKRTALLECNKHQDLRLIQEAYDWSHEENNTFSFSRITCFREVEINQIPEIYCGQYDCIILDFGTDLRACRNEFLRCSANIVVGGQSEWDRIKLQRFVNETDFLRGSIHWLYFIPHADNRTVRKVSTIIRRKVYSVPMMADPTLPSKLSIKFFGQLL